MSSESASGNGKGNGHSSGDALDSLARRRLEEHPLFQNRTATLNIVFDGETLFLTGRLPSYYLKQILQEIVKTLPGSANIENQVDVVSSDGLSSIHRPAGVA